METKAVIFDAYGTLLDVHSVHRQTESAFPGHGEAITRQWRAKQLEYTWLRTLMVRYEPFHTVTRDALRYAIRSRGLPADETVIERLMQAYESLDLFPDVADALEALSGYRRAVLTNADPGMIEPAIRAAGLERVLETVISVDRLRLYKPDPRTYALACSMLDLAPEDILFVSSNAFDVAGAANFGLRVAWVNRGGLVADELGVFPSQTVETLRAIPELVS